MNSFRKVLCLLLLTVCIPCMGQRQMERLDRGIVAFPKSSSQIFVSWRHFATDPDAIAYNLYYKITPDGALVKLNKTPITNSTNFTANLAAKDASYTFVVKSVLNGVERDEPGSYTVARNTGTLYCSHIVKDFDFAPLPEGYTQDMPMKFCWPADLDGDGRYDFVLDRQGYSGESEDGEEGTTSFPTLLEAYSSDGQFLWRINMGTNVNICNGHSDKVTAYDMNGDGRAEVLLTVGEGTTFADGKVVTGKDGTITDYSKLSGSAPQWLAVVDGLTGVELDRMEIPLQKELKTDRTDSWKDISGHFIILYADGIHPSLLYQYKNRQVSGAFTGAHALFSFNDGKLKLNWAKLNENGAEFHQVRAADVDGDGCDEFVEGGYALKGDGTLLSVFDGIVHGDRHCLTDIDPDRPGLEQFFIQQNNPQTMGMGLTDPRTGELINGIYMSGVGDVGRGTCAAFDTTIRGLQFFSTMSSYAMYNAKGIAIESSKGNFPAEALWWGANLSRRHITSAGNNKNPVIDSYSPTSHSIGRETSLYKENNGHGDYYFRAPNGGRAAFWGDLFGDWREELIYCRNNNTGFVILSTWDETAHRQYTLMQNPGYRCQTTARGYYQTPDVDFYMATDMPQPPVAPVQKADLYYTHNGWVDSTETSDTYTDGKSVMFDIRGGNDTLTLNENRAPGHLWLINPLGKDYVFEGPGKLTGSMDVTKSLQGTVTFNGHYDYTGDTRISEGRLNLNGSLAGKVLLNARGVLGGNATLKGGITVETGLNAEGGRLEPGVEGTLGTMHIFGNLALPGRNNLAFDTDQTQVAKNDTLCIEGDFTLTNNNHRIHIRPITPIKGDTLTLITFTGATNAQPSHFSLTGMEGIPYELLINEHSLQLVVTEPRGAANITWSGAQSSIWDFQTKNFRYNTLDNIFVPGDTVTFTDEALRKAITLDKTMPVGGMVFNNSSTFTISGDGSISGNGGLKKSGTGKLSLLNTANSFTGGVEINGGTLEVAALVEGGLPSSIGASSADAANWVMRNATLQTAGQMYTNRNMLVEDTLTINNPTNKNSIVMAGDMTSEGGTLELKGKGTLTLQGKNKFSTITVHDGLLLLGSALGNKQSMGSAKVILQGGTFRMYNASSFEDRGTFTNEIHVPEGANAVWELPSRWYFTNKLTGSGIITIKPNQYRNDLAGTFAAFTGKIIFSGSDIRLNSPNTRNLAKADVELNDGTYVCVASDNGKEVSGSNAIAFGSLSGTGNLSGKNTYTIGAKGTNTTYGGVFNSGSGKLVKIGDGSLTLSGSNLYTGGTTLSEGQLIIANAEGSATGTGAVTVEKSATLMGTGTIAGITTIKAGGVLMPGKTETTVGTLKFGSNLTMQAGAKLVIKVRGAVTYDKVQVTGNAILRDTLEMNRQIGTYVAGNKYAIVTAGGTLTNEFTTIVPETPGEGLAWDLSLLDEGIIQVVAADGVHTPSALGTQVFPTLVEDICHVLVNDLTTPAVMEVLNAQGAVLQVFSVKIPQTDLSLSNYPVGSYFIRINRNGKSFSHKIIKIK